ncbi:NAD(P)/FAD-dependent oxidoreductase [Chryseobacterium caseinilyticum]|uniref:NADH:ubiquinone reductase (non-electrogenic) n=1 Tax=Chryseobacterium caseinilyticum TaxID=2771428 RepID=A0ABR8Z875_9FLAO|nr:NAD(P)/FAD-dependent oxidoreductase [Chryseobacterium caseinilyticum]MBD8081503.1 NAD(P)/FAD-dependent oxidoreductase [Chryseobacterium caseinilyticum]
MEKHIVIVGGGFAGLNLIKTIGDDERFRITLVDRNNYHFFPPLIYQVATAFIEPSNISYPFRKLFSKYSNVSLYMASLERVVPEENRIITDQGTLHYDELVLALGTETNFFGIENVRKNALPMKTIDEALYIRNHILQNLETASRNAQTESVQSLINIVIAGGGPTGVELAGMIAEMAGYIAEKDYPDIAFGHTNLYLVDALPSLLSNMSDTAKKTAYDNLKRLGVNIKLNVSVKDYVEENVILSDGTKIPTKTLIWSSGVVGRTIEGIPETSLGKGHRIIVDSYNLVEGFKNIYALGDICITTTDPEFPKGHPQLAQVAIQQAKLLGKNIKKRFRNEPLKEFRYDDKGSMAIISKYNAVVDLPKFSFNGLLAWLTWLFIHIIPLTSFRNKYRLAAEWFRLFITNNASIRMIMKPRKEN